MLETSKLRANTGRCQKKLPSESVSDIKCVRPENVSSVHVCVWVEESFEDKPERDKHYNQEQDVMNDWDLSDLHTFPLKSTTYAAV